tara:strand:- start:476 stop:2317 length:1842 start_codon:yes stop_codon:yes gene_type:complete
MAEQGPLPRLNQSTNRAAQAKMEERSQLSLAAQGKIALDGAFRNSLLSENNTHLKDIVNLLAMAEEMRARDAQMEAEDRLEMKRKLNAQMEMDKKEQAEQVELDPFGIGAFLAGVTAIAGAFVGLRGWEMGAIRRLGELRVFSKTIPDSVKAIREAIRFNLFGTNTRLTPDKIKGIFVEQKPFIMTIRERISAIRQGITNALFGALRGGPQALAPLLDPQGRVATVIESIKKVGGGAFTFISESAKTIFKPFKDIFTGIKNFMSGDGAGGKFLGAIGGTVGAFLKMVGRIFKPIGILFSFGEGVMEFMKTEGNIFKKLNAGAARFLADFIGAPLDLLLVKLPAKVMELLGFESASKWIKENVRFEDALFSILTFPMQVIEKLLEAGKKLLSGDFAGAAKVIVDPILKLFKAISNAFMNFIRSIPVVGRLFKDENEKIEEDIEKNRKEKDRLAELELKNVERQKANAERIVEIQEEIEKKLAGRELDDLGFFEKNSVKGMMREIALLNNDSERARELNELQKEKLAKLEEDNKVLLARLREGTIDFETATGTPSGNGSADMLSALANFSGDGFGATRLTDNSTIVGDSNSIAINNQSFQTGARVGSQFRNYFAT